jgi:hypothetical protein
MEMTVAVIDRLSSDPAVQFSSLGLEFHPVQFASTPHKKAIL